MKTAADREKGQGKRVQRHANRGKINQLAGDFQGEEWVAFGFIQDELSKVCEAFLVFEKQLGEEFG